MQAGAIEIQELGQAENPKENRCDPGMRQLARYRGLLDGDVLTLVSGRQQTRLYRIHAATATMAPGDRLPADLWAQYDALLERLGEAAQRRSAASMAPATRKVASPA